VPTSGRIGGRTSASAAYEFSPPFPASSAAGLHRTVPSYRIRPMQERAGVGARDQARRIPPDRDIRPVPLEQRKGKLEKLLARSNGIQFSEHLAGDGATIFAHACKLGLEGIVSKRRDLPDRSGRCRGWIKVKNPASPAVLRIQDGTW
jgi:hypothetical protein